MTATYPRSRRVFVDTGAYYAFADADDENHEAALRIATQLAAEHRPLFTTNFILAETHALCLNRLNRRLAMRVLAEIEHSQSTTIVRVSALDERQAHAILEEYDDKRYSYTDATSFAVMERLRIATSFAFDRHFAQYGFQVLSEQGQ